MGSTSSFHVTLPGTAVSLNSRTLIKRLESNDVPAFAAPVTDRSISYTWPSRYWRGRFGSLPVIFSVVQPSLPVAALNLSCRAETGVDTGKVPPILLLEIVATTVCPASGSPKRGNVIRSEQGLPGLIR